MKKLASIAAIALVMASCPAMAAETTPAPAAAAKAAAKYSTADTEIGTLLDDPAARAIIDKHIPGMTSNDQIDMARAMTLKAIQQYAPEITDEILAAIDADFAALK